MGAGIMMMLVRSVISYTIFLASRKLVRSSMDIGESIKKHLKLHRCTECFRLYSGEITKCTLCGAFAKPLYDAYQEDNRRAYFKPEDPEKREGIERQVYNDTRKAKFEAMRPPKLELNHGRNSSQHREPSTGDQRRNRRTPRDFTNDRRVSNSGF